MKRYEATLLPTNLAEFLNLPSWPIRDASFFIGRKAGERAYHALKPKLLETPEGSPLVIKFSPSQLIDVSYADESLVRIGKEILSGDYGERCLLLKGLSDASVTNLNAAIIWRKLRLVFLAVEPTGQWKHIGQLGSHHLETLEFVAMKGSMTVGEVVKKYKLQINTASNRLKRLYDLRLLRREGEITNNGWFYTYYFWQWHR
jgi:DNA-binding transcriptional ArsR family regulator